MNMDDYLEEFRRTLKKIRDSEEILSRDKATILENINKIKRAQYERAKSEKVGS